MRKSLAVAVPLALLLASGCRRPPDAPDELDQLCAWIFAEFGAEEEASMEAGLVNLDTWIRAHLDETLEGYSVSALDVETVGALPRRSGDGDVDGLAGAAVGSEVSHSVYAITWALVMEDPEEVFADQHELYEREFLSDPECFMAMECETLDASNYMEDAFPLGVDMATHTYGQYRWVETELGTAMVQRTWFQGAAEVSVDWLSVDEQFYLNVLLPDGNGTLAVQSMWVEASLGEDAVPESMALNLVISQMQGVYEQVEGYVTEHQAHEYEEKGCAAAGGAPRGGLALAGALGLLLARRRDLRGGRSGVRIGR